MKGYSTSISGFMLGPPVSAGLSSKGQLSLFFLFMVLTRSRLNEVPSRRCFQYLLQYPAITFHKAVLKLGMRGSLRPNSLSTFLAPSRRGLFLGLNASPLLPTDLQSSLACTVHLVKIHCNTGFNPNFLRFLAVCPPEPLPTS